MIEVTHQFGWGPYLGKLRLDHSRIRFLIFKKCQIILGGGVLLRETFLICDFFSQVPRPQVASDQRSESCKPVRDSVVFSFDKGDTGVCIAVKFSSFVSYWFLCGTVSWSIMRTKLSVMSMIVLNTNLQFMEDKKYFVIVVFSFCFKVRNKIVMLFKKRIPDALEMKP